MAEFLGGYDRRTRRVILLAGAAGLAVLGAVATLGSTTEREAPAFERRAFFPDLTGQLRSVAKVEIVSVDGTVTIERDGDGVWIVPEKDGYPADIRPLREVFEGLRSLDILAPKTANAGWHSHLDLKAPERDGKAVKLRLTDAEGGEIAALLVGKEDETGEVSGRDRFHARRPGENQTWLVTGRVARDTDPASWLDTRLVEVDREAVRSVEVTPAEGPAYRASRADRRTPDYTLDAIPEGRETRSPFIINGVAGAIAGLTFEDVMARDDLTTDGAAEPDPVATAIYRTFDGLVVEVTQFEEGAEEGSDAPAERWVTLAARAEPPAPPAEPDAADAQGEDETAASTDDPAPEGDDPAAPEKAPQTGVISAEVGALVNRINRLAEGRVFRLASYTAEQMAKPLDELLTPTDTVGEGTEPAPGDGQADADAPAGDRGPAGDRAPTDDTGDAVDGAGQPDTSTPGENEAQEAEDPEQPERDGGTDPEDPDGR
ncbi:MAG: DUF4340 domain-containing protein [Alphaproteobacteria bacterium]